MLSFVLRLRPSFKVGVWAFRSRVWGVGFVVWGLSRLRFFTIYCSWFGFRVWRLGFRVQGLGVILRNTVLGSEGYFPAIA